VTDTVSLTPQADAGIRQNTPHANAGSSTALKAGVDGGKGWVLIRFDTTAIRANLALSDLQLAVLRLTVTSSTDFTGTEKIRIHRLTKNWVESGATWSCANDTNTTNTTLDCASADEWLMLSDNYAPFDHSAIDSADVNGATTSIAFDVTSDVEAFQAGAPHYGWILIKSPTEPGRIAFSSREGTSPPALTLITEQESLSLAEPEDVPSDSIIGILYADSNLVHTSTHYVTPFPSNVIWVVFNDASSLSAREAALDSVNGVVVAGQRIHSGGIFYVAIPGDGTDGPVYNAIEKLKTLPQVAVASHDMTLDFTVSHRTPGDGAGWQRSDYTLDPTSAAGNNWHLERINAPMAWGCEIGDVNVRIGIEDVNFGRPSDLLPNVADSANALMGVTTDPNKPSHGTGVASIVAARGNNGQDMTGVMWRAGLVLRSNHKPHQGAPSAVYLPFYNLQDIYRQDDVRVITFTGSPNYGGQTPVPTNSAHVTQTTAFADYLAQSVSAISFDANMRGTPRPLIVMSAGNEGKDAYWAGRHLVADSPNVIVVAASTIANNIATFSNRNCIGGGCNDTPPTGATNSVHVIAPGEDVYMLDNGGTLYQNSGTSFAAPVVGGVAGLMVSFDTTIAGDSMKAILLRSGSSTIAGLPVVDAYEALREVAKRQGAPICGNRMWWSGDSIVVQRRTPQDPGGATQETLYRDTAVSNWPLLPMHGGMHIQYESKELRYVGGQWQPSGTQVAIDTLLFYAAASYLGTARTHAFGDTAFADTTFFAFADTSGVLVVDRYGTYTGAQYPQLTTTLPLPTRTGPVVCVEEVIATSACVQQFALASVVHVPGGGSGLAVSPRSDSVFVGRTDYETVSDSVTWVTCGGNPSNRCGTVYTTTQSTAATVYAVGINSSGWASRSMGSDAIRQIGMADNKELMFVRAGILVSAVFDQMQLVGISTTYANCRVDYERGGTVVLTRSVSQATCADQFNTGSIGARRRSVVVDRIRSR
jgi:hypothetical protein